MAYLKYYVQHAIEWKVSLWSLGRYLIVVKAVSIFISMFRNMPCIFISTRN